MCMRHNTAIQRPVTPKETPTNATQHHRRLRQAGGLVHKPTLIADLPPGPRPNHPTMYPSGMPSAVIVFKT